MKVIRFSCLLTALCALGGCSEPTGPRTVRAWGEVSYDGAAVEDGTIDFVPTDDASPAQAQIKAGRYDLPAPAGPLSPARSIGSRSAR